MKTDTITKPENVTDVDFCVISRGDREALERTMFSIALYHREARITVANAVMEHDRAYFKKLQGELEEAGLMLRVVAHHLPVGATIAEAKNFLMANTRLKYKLMLVEGHEITEDTNLINMMAIMDHNSAIGIVVGAYEGEPVTSELDMKLGDIHFAKTKAFGAFALVRREIVNFARYSGTDESCAAEFTGNLGNIPYQIVILPSSIIKNSKPNDENKEPSGNGDGGAPERNIQSGNGDGADSTVLPSGKDEAGKDTAPRGGQSGSGTGPVRGQNK